MLYQNVNDNVIRSDCSCHIQYWPRYGVQSNTLIYCCKEARQAGKQDAACPRLAQPHQQPHRSRGQRHQHIPPAGDIHCADIIATAKMVNSISNMDMMGMLDISSSFT